MKVDPKSGGVSWGDAEKTFDILLAGDLCPRGQTEKLVLAGKNAAILAAVRSELDRGDLSVVNLETPLTGANTPIPKSGPNIKVSPACVELVKSGGWDVACCANNHIGDYGPEAVTETLSLLAANGIAAVGAGKDLASARQPLIIEKDGLKIAVLAFAENEFGIATETVPGGNPLQPLRNIAQIKTASAQADITMVLIHGGNEFNPIPSPRMVETCRAFAEAGASAVVAGHTHCPQGIELWHGVPIVYSLGNFLFDSDGSYSGYNWWYGYMVRLGFAAGRAVRLEVIPHHCLPRAEKVTPLQGEERERFLTYLNELSRIAADGREGQKYFDAWCLRGINGYFSRLGTPFMPLDWNDADAVSGFMAMRNLHTCEAHNELVTATLRIIGEKRETTAAEYLPRLERLCHAMI